MEKNKVKVMITEKKPMYQMPTLPSAIVNGVCIICSMKTEW